MGKCAAASMLMCGKVRGRVAGVGGAPLSESGFAGLIRIFGMAGDRFLSVGRVFLATDEGEAAAETRVRDAASLMGAGHTLGWEMFACNGSSQ